MLQSLNSPLLFGPSREISYPSLQGSCSVGASWSECRFILGTCPVPLRVRVKALFLRVNAPPPLSFFIWWLSSFIKQDWSVASLTLNRFISSYIEKKCYFFNFYSRIISLNSRLHYFIYRNCVFLIHIPCFPLRSVIKVSRRFFLLWRLVFGKFCTVFNAINFYNQAAFRRRVKELTLN